nr:aminotransferase class V-fold PLP-dependent enzyme [Micromonospora sp. NBRC 107566]
MGDRGHQPPAAIPGGRLLFSLDPAVAHLNHGSFGSVPISVQRAQQRLRDEAESNPLRFHTVGLVDRIAHTRRHLASFVGADPALTALVENATVGTNLVLGSLRLGAGDEILTTDRGYGAVRLAVDVTCRRTGATSRTVNIPLDAADDAIVAALAAALRPGRTKLLIVDQITSSTARLLPVTRIAAAARAQGVPILVDGAHVPGMLPVDVTAIGADFWVGNFHKWAFAPRGTALLTVAPAWRERMEPLVVSWEQESGFPTNVEWRATADYTSWLAAPAGLFTLRTLGVDAVRAHNTALAAYGQRVIGEALNLPPAELPDPGGPVAMRLIPLPAGIATTQDAAAALRQRIGEQLAAEVNIAAWNGRGYLRVCAQVYNRPEEYERLARSLPTLLG